MSEERAKFGRVFDAAVGADWAITEDGLRTVLAVASRTNPIEAVEAYRSEPHEHAYQLKVRDGVGIIPVTGPISRYTTWFSLFSGGTSVQILAPALQAALDDPNVHSILFEINSPGGEVTGVNEFAQMVLKARSVKPITARVGGLGCSAAYWIAAMCGDVVIDDTAQLGSIGVYAAYFDDRKALEMRGLTEIEFISSQSPYKNSPPYEAEGKTRIQNRLDALCAVFINSVAEGRGVDPETVAKEFGQGDVFVGQAAIDAGLADRLGSFEDTLASLARTHTPGYVGTSPAEPVEPEYLDDPFDDDEDLPEAEGKTIKNSSQVEFETVETESAAEAVNDPKQNEELMSEKNDDLNNAGAAEGQEPIPAAKEAAASPAAEPNAAAVPAPATAEEVAAMRKQLADQKTQIDTLQAEAENKWLEETASQFGGSTESNITVLGALVKAYGKESKEVAAFIENQKALTAQVDETALFGEIGKRGGSQDANSAEAQVDAKARELMKTDSSLTIQQARDKVYEQNPDLYEQLS